MTVRIITADVLEGLKQLPDESVHCVVSLRSVDTCAHRDRMFACTDLVQETYFIVQAFAPCNQLWWANAATVVLGAGLVGGHHVDQRGREAWLALSTVVVRQGEERTVQGFNERWDAMEKAEQCSGMRNARDVWTIATEPFPDAHYATFPSALAERCIKAGCPERGTVLDPFGGSGTVGVVADRLGRAAILIDIDPANKEMAERRIAKDRLERGIQSMEEVAKAKLPPTPLEALMQQGEGP